MNVDILVAGVISLDTSLHVPFVPAKDSECFAFSVRDFHGGAAANFAAFSAFYGKQSVGLIARVGDDSIGEALLDRLSQYNVNLNGTIRTSGMATTRIFTLLIQDGSRSYIIDLGAHEALSPRDIPASYVSSARAFYLAPCSPDIHADFLDFALSQQWTVFFNPGTVYVEQAEKTRLYPLISKSHFLFLNEMEAITYSGKNTLLDAGRFFLEFGPRHVIITASNQDSFAFSANEEAPLSVPSKRVNAINAIGAGDAFAAGFISEYFKTDDIYSALLNGSIYGAYVVTQEEVRAANPFPLAIKQFEDGYK